MLSAVSKKITEGTFGFLRYSRQISIEGFGEEGQKKLKNASILIAGAGGLGGVVSMCLAAAGVGKIGLIDGDIVELSNLNRQILFDLKDVGEKKVAVAEKKLMAFNPQVKIQVLDCNLNEKNAEKLTEGYDLLVDALDNFDTRYVLNKIAQKRGLPLVHGAVGGFEGRITTILPGKTPCLKCIYPEAPAKKDTPVVGVAPAVIGSLQSTEVIKYLLGMGNLLAGRLLVYDGLSMEFIEVKMEKVPGCVDCRV